VTYIVTQYSLFRVKRYVTSEVTIAKRYYIL